MFSEAKAQPVDDSLPSEAKVKEALNAVVKDAEGQEHQLSSLLAGGKRTIIIFIRHNHCGMCMEYVRACSKNAKLAATASAKATDESPSTTTQTIVIGHGSWEGIELYKKNSDCVFDVYMDGDKKAVYNALGLTRRFLGKSKDAIQKEGKISYIQDHQSPISLAFSSLWGQLRSGHLIFKGGDVTLLGGEFVFDKDAKCIFAHRMKDSTDHTSVEDLAKQVDG